MHESILETLRQSYEVYKNDGAEVQLHWYSYTDKIDKMVEEAFRYLNMSHLLISLIIFLINGKIKLTFLYFKYVLSDGTIEEVYS